MFLRFDENPNCGWTDDRVFTPRSEPRRVSRVLRTRAGQEVWCAVTGLEADGLPVPAWGCKIEDSGDGIAYLIYGGSWGLRLREPSCHDGWSLADPHQWGEGFLLLPAQGTDLEWDPSSPTSGRPE